MHEHRTALNRLRRWSPAALHRVTARLRELGGKAYLVGGVVRDAFLNRVGADWDIATDLKPDQVANAFSNVVRAGEKHGTIMVIEDSTPFEVTTFRGEGPYVDGRRPEYVEFHRDIERDLARRDFAMNAIAVDLNAGEWVDPFGGVRDIQRRRVRCVGEPSERFKEDGLRPLRAVRFRSVLNFEVESNTEAALGGALDTFGRVAWERKRVELEKALVGVAVDPALSVLEASGLLNALAPELVGVSRPELARLPLEPWLRVSAWLERARLNRADRMRLVKRFKVSGEVERNVEAWSAALAVEDVPLGARAFRHWLAEVGVRGARGAVAIWEGTDRISDQDARRLRRRLRQPAPHRLKDLAITGDDLLALGFRGKQVGETLKTLLEGVLDSPSRNRRTLLLEAAHRLSTSDEAPGDD